MFQKLKATIENYDVFSLLIINSACQLMPMNANKLMRFEAMAFTICSCEYIEKKPNISKSRIKSIYNGSLYGLDGVSVYEDPFEQMFTESIAFFGGSYTVFPGITEQGTFILKHLLKSIFLSEYKPEYEDFYKEAYNVATLFLVISNTMAEKASLNYGVESKVVQKEIQLPHPKIEVELKKAVTLNIEEIESLLNEKEADIQCIEEFLIHFGDVDFNEYSKDNHLLHQKPFLRHENKIVVSMPCDLLGTLRHALIKIALKHGFVDELENSFKRKLWSTTDDLLNRMGIKKAKNMLPPFSNEEKPFFEERMFTFDSDKLMYVQMHTDDFENYDPSIVYDGNIQFDQYFERRALEVKKHLKEKNPSLKDVFTLILLQPAGRSMSLGLNRLVDETHLLMSVSDLEIVAFLEGGDPLHLYKYAKAHNNLNNNSKVFSMGFLDTYSIYRFNDKSFYLSDEVAPNSVYFSVGEGRDLIEETHRMIRPHGVPLPNGRDITEVVSVYEDSGIPIFVPPRISNDNIAYIVEGNDWKVWITSSQMHPIYGQIVDMIAYWIWQFSAEINRVISAEAIFEIKVNLYPFEQWIEPVNPSKENTTNSPISFEVVGNKIYVNIHHVFSKNLEGSTNFGERELMKTILLAIEEFSGASLSKSVENLLNEVSPLGPKKKLLVFNQNNISVLFEPGIFPKLRFVDSADENVILDNIGLWLRKKMGLGVGKLENQKEVINNVVGYLFSEIERIISGLKDPEHILQILMLHYEALIHKREEKRITITTTLHCFSNRKSMIDKINEDLNNFNKLSVSLRFLIEYVGACPPREGTNVFSLEIFDRLIALSSMLIQWANNSDLINYQLADLQVSMLPSQRLGTKHDNAYFSASTKFFRQHSSETLNNAIESYDSIWKDKIHSNKDEIDSDIVDAEFGVSFNDFFNFISNVSDIGREIRPEVKCLSIEKFNNLLQSKYSMYIQTINNVLNILCLKERRKFLSPPDSFRKEDIFPWKFNRELSYLRRPFIINGDNVLWSNRHLYYCGRHLIDLCLGGRLKAKSEKMKRLISKYQNINGERFNDLIESLFIPFDFVITKGRVKKFGNKKIEGVKGDLGDIDVLVINPKKKVIYVIECKDLSVARNPYEINYELNNMFIGTKKKPSIMEKHLKRTDWIRTNIKLVLNTFGINLKGKWNVKPLIVLDEEMVSPYLYKDKKGIKVMSYNKLIEELQNAKFFRL
ncbi:hypothetical protein DZB84_18370 [Bacillus sp. HNG]|uniref:hypothetical protein n=1 Tax=Bacillus sp. HNG TaxID=2293325 RepID=UPI000E2ED85A|nr:hypothetical protein [Bacillus sp. HNG]RFB12716.1 hypothetical protein DZB84_18370 [Bacillus sp. HNG]